MITTHGSASPIFSPEVLRKIGETLGGTAPLGVSSKAPSRTFIHTVYGGAQIFKSGIAAKLGQVALHALEEYAPNPKVLAEILDWGNEGARLSPEQTELLYSRLKEKLAREPVEDFRIDFEDGYGIRADSEEDAHAQSAARELAQGLKQGTLPPSIGIRIKSLNPESASRALRTLDLFLSTLLSASGDTLPPRFVVTLPKITAAAQVSALVEALTEVERARNLAAKSLLLELMIETPQSVLNRSGGVAIPELIERSQGRCAGLHFGTYDYTASLGISSADQAMRHPACELAKQFMLLSVAGTDIPVSDGATALLPIGPHRAPAGEELTAPERLENRAAVERSWRLSARNIRHSLETGIYQGWDLHPAQMPVRYAVTYAHFIGHLDDAAFRLRNFIESATQATRVGGAFDDAATGQGLLNFFLRGMACGALTEEDARATGLQLEELRTASFSAILHSRQKPSVQKQKP